MDLAADNYRISCIAGIACGNGKGNPAISASKPQRHYLLYVHLVKDGTTDSVRIILILRAYRHARSKVCDTMQSVLRL